MKSPKQHLEFLLERNHQEKLEEAKHQIWVRNRRAEGYTYGPKEAWFQHPDVREYRLLPADKKGRYVDISNTVLSFFYETISDSASFDDVIDLLLDTNLLHFKSPTKNPEEEVRTLVNSLREYVAANCAQISESTGDVAEWMVDGLKTLLVYAKKGESRPWEKSFSNGGFLRYEGPNEPTIRVAGKLDAMITNQVNTFSRGNNSAELPRDSYWNSLYKEAIIGTPVSTTSGTMLYKVVANDKVAAVAVSPITRSGATFFVVPEQDNVGVYKFKNEFDRMELGGTERHLTGLNTWVPLFEETTPLSLHFGVPSARNKNWLLDRIVSDYFAR